MVDLQSQYYKIKNEVDNYHLIYRICINPIAGKLVATRAYFLFGLTMTL